MLLTRTESAQRTIPGTPIFDGEAARKGIGLNAMCYSFNSAESRAAFVADEEGYMDRFELTDQQRQAVRRRDVPGMIDAGGNVYYLAKLAGIFGLDVQDLGALQTGMAPEDFKAGLLAHGITERSIAS
jgi:protocatechuate 4,5-dioxygenase alpha chain